jgi:gas vesicle protein
MANYCVYSNTENVVVIFSKENSQNILFIHNEKGISVPGKVDGDVLTYQNPTDETNKIVFAENILYSLHNNKATQMNIIKTTFYNNVIFQFALNNTEPAIERIKNIIVSENKDRLAKDFITEVSATPSIGKRKVLTTLMKEHGLGDYVAEMLPKKKKFTKDQVGKITLNGGYLIKKCSSCNFIYQANEKIYKTHRMKEHDDSVDNSVDAIKKDLNEFKQNLKEDLNTSMIEMKQDLSNTVSVIKEDLKEDLKNKVEDIKTDVTASVNTYLDSKIDKLISQNEALLKTFEKLIPKTKNKK